MARQADAVARAASQLEDNVLVILRSDCEAEIVGSSRVKLTIEYNPDVVMGMLGGEIYVAFSGFGSARRAWATSEDEAKRLLRSWMAEDAQWMHEAAERLAELSGFRVVGSRVVLDSSGCPTHLELELELAGEPGVALK